VRSTLTDLLDTAGVLLVAAGCGFLAAGFLLVLLTPGGIVPTAAGVGLLVSGSAILAASWLSDRTAKPDAPIPDTGGDDL
jgi:hypothetical protein